MRADRVWRNARLLHIGPAALAVRDGRIVWIGADAQAPDAPEVHDCEGRWITPGLIDCHTHLVHAGNRAAEFEQRLAGIPYEQIARAGGGILSTVRATRTADAAALQAASLKRLDALLAEGVTTIEIKSGYGLDLPTEMRQLRVARGLTDMRAVDVSTSFLGLHALPPDTDRAGFVAQVCETMLPAIAAAHLADAVDAFCESIAFTPDEVARLFTAARAWGLPVRLHADQLSDTGGAALAARFGALSADHLEYANPDGIAAMARAGTVAVLLPGAFYTLREAQVPPVAALRAAGVPIALATDCNPGTAPMTSILLAMNMGATMFRLTVAECIDAVTLHAARALGRDDIGRLALGCRCDLAIWNIETPAELVYRIGFNPLHQRVVKGVPC